MTVLRQGSIAYFTPPPTQTLCWLGRPTSRIVPTLSIEAKKLYILSHEYMASGVVPPSPTTPTTPTTAFPSASGTLSPPPRPDRSHSRPSSRPSSRSSVRSSVRAPSPSMQYDDPGRFYSLKSLYQILKDALLAVSVRNQISTLKHNIRHQQAQVHDLENIILRGPRPYSNDIFASSSSPSSSPPNAYHLSGRSSSPAKLGKRPSYEVMQSLADSGSSLPLPRRMLDGGESNGIKEGIPTGSSGSSYRRNSSPDRSLSRECWSFTLFPSSPDAWVDASTAFMLTSEMI